MHQLAQTTQYLCLCEDCPAEGDGMRMVGGGGMIGAIPLPHVINYVSYAVPICFHDSIPPLSI